MKITFADADAVADGASHGTIELGLADLSFVDCTGYGTMMRAVHVIEQRDGHWIVSGASDRPGQLLQPIAPLA